MGCRNCAAPLPDLGAQATGACPSCGTLYGVRAEIEDYAAGVVAGRPVERPKSLASSRLKVRFDPGAGGDYRNRGADRTLTITLRYFSKMSFVSLLLGLLGLAGLGYVWYVGVQTHSYVIAGLVTLPVGFYIWARVSSVFDSLLIRASGGELIYVQSDIRPRIQAKVPIADITQLFTARTGRTFVLVARLRDGTAKLLVRDIGKAELAIYLERQIELALGIQDQAVDKELPKNAPSPKRASPLKVFVIEFAILTVFVLAPSLGMKACGTSLAEIAVADEPHQTDFELKKATRLSFTSEIELTESNWRYPKDIPRAMTFEIEILQAGKTISQLSCDPFEVFAWTTRSHNHSLNGFWGPMDNCVLELAPGHYTVRAARKWKPNMQRIGLDESVLGLRED
jgi:hypothetical protein